MWGWIRALDGVLRGEATRPAALRDGTIRIPVPGLTVVIVILGLLAGFCVGWFALFNRQPPEYRQVLAAAVKVPLLFFLTLLVTFPSLYVFNALVGSRLSLPAVLRLLIAALAVTVTVVASFGPITAFFSVSTENYPFMVLLNVVLFGVAGLLGLLFLLQTLQRLSLVAAARGGLPEPPADPAAPADGPAPAGGEPRPEAADDTPGALDALAGHVLGTHVKAVFRCWVIVFGLVGAQMAWVLRPFIGDPGQPFAWFRPRASNFFEAVYHAALSLFR